MGMIARMIANARIAKARMIANASTAEKDFFLNCSQDEFERLCSLDVLGLVEQPDSNSEFRENFTSHLHQTEEGVYETRLYHGNLIAPSYQGTKS